MANYPSNISRLIDICRRNDVLMVGVFGSMSRGEARKNSDIDLIVPFSKRKSLLALVRLERELTEALGNNVPQMDWRKMLDELHVSLRVELAGRTLLEPEEIIRQGREERDEQLIDNLR